MTTQKIAKKIIYHVLVFGFGLLMLYPLLWMVMSSFKETHTVLNTASQLIPSKFVIDNYVNGWKGFGGVSFKTFFKNSLFISTMGTIGTIFSSSLVAYGFSRCRFRGKKLLFSAMLVSMMLPAQILMVPQYLWFQKLGWIGTFSPLIIPYYFAVQGFFIYLMKCFIDGIPKELDASAKIDGCSYYGIFRIIILPLMSPVIITSAIFSFMWRWDDFMSALIYTNSVKKYPVSLALKLFADPSSSSDFGAMFAMATLSLIPLILFFFVFQRYLVEGIAASGLKR